MTKTADTNTAATIDDAIRWLDLLRGRLEIMKEGALVKKDRSNVDPSFAKAAEAIRNRIELESRGLGIALDGSPWDLVVFNE